MPILDLDPRFRELGRLRLGEDLGDRPTALDHWRLTSPHEDLLVAASALYGGTVDVWQDGFELTTTATELDVLIPNQDVSAGQWLELWSGSTISRRCNGRNLVNNAGDEVGVCQCDIAERECKPVTHLRVVLPQLPDLGIWRLVTRSIYAAIELPGTVALLLRTHGGDLAPAVLAIEHRRGAQRRPFVVPVLRSRSTFNQLVEAGHPTAGLVASSPPAANLAALSTATPPRSAELENTPNPSEAPRSPATAPNEDPSPPPQDFPKMDEWRRLGRLLAANPPAGIAEYVAGELIGLLTDLEELMVDVGLWPIPTSDGVTALDSSAARRGLDDWRTEGAYTTDRLRTFTKRSLLDAGPRFTEHRNGRAVTLEALEVAP